MLLDSNKLTKDLQEHCKRLSCDIKSELVKEVYETAYQHVIEFIEIQPAAYDVEKVVAEEKEFLVNYGVPENTAVHRKIIDIVRKGGVNE